MDTSHSIVAIGLATGLISSLSGLGAGLALPALAVCGIPLPGALLATKLPVAAGDLVQALGDRSLCGSADTCPGQTTRAKQVALWLLCGAFGAGASTLLPAGVLLPLMSLVSITALAYPALQRRQQGGSDLDGTEQMLWTFYIGGLGAASGLLLACRARLQGHDWRVGRQQAYRLGAAANLGAVLVLATTQPLSQPLLLLAIAQGLGAGAGRSLSATRLPFGRPQAALEFGPPAKADRRRCIG